MAQVPNGPAEALVGTESRWHKGYKWSLVKKWKPCIQNSYMGIYIIYNCIINYSKIQQLKTTDIYHLTVMWVRKPGEAQLSGSGSGSPVNLQWSCGLELKDPLESFLVGKLASFRSSSCWPESLSSSPHQMAISIALPTTWLFASSGVSDAREKDDGQKGWGEESRRGETKMGGKCGYISNTETIAFS